MLRVRELTMQLRPVTVCSYLFRPAVPAARLSHSASAEKAINNPQKHPALQPGRVAVITGAANGIGRAVAQRCAVNGMKVVLADLSSDQLEGTIEEFVALGVTRSNLLAVPTDVADLEQNQALCTKAYGAFDACHLVLFNAGIGTGVGMSPIGMDITKWRKTIEVNLWGTLNGLHCFVPRMLEQTDGVPSIVAATSSRQGLTLNPGDTSYVISKAGQRAVMESLEHELRNLPGHKIRAVLLCPGRVVTDIIAQNAESSGNAAEAAKMRENLRQVWGADAMDPSNTVDVLFETIEEGKFYGVCTDHYKTKAAAIGEIESSYEDIALNRPPLSRWHPAHQPAFLAANPEAKEVPLEPEARKL